MVPVITTGRIDSKSVKAMNTTRKISAYAHLHGTHSYTRKPLAPLGCAVQAHEKADECGSWDMHAVDGYYVGTSVEDHRCFSVWIKKKKAIRVTGTVFFKHKYLTQPN